MKKITKLLWNVASFTDENKSYDVTFNSETGFECTCPDFMYRKSTYGGKVDNTKNGNGNVCKHIKKVMIGKGGGFYKVSVNICECCGAVVSSERI